MGRILHIGLGNFARAHLADYTQDAGGWEITGVSLRSPAIRDGLAAQGYDYTLAIHGRAQKRITVVRDMLVGPERPAAVLAAIADPTVQIISATVTEKGYHLDTAGRLDMENAAIKADLRRDGLQTLTGYLAYGLSVRQTPVTVLSCDNMQSNGDTLQKAVADFAEAVGLKINFSQISFPNTMVDRITPATTDALRAGDDPMAVPTEPFREWVIEDRFAAKRPNWPDVQFVADVAPYELRKLRMLNGAHSYLAYAGLLAGHSYVHEAIANPELRASVIRLMAQAADTLPDEMHGQTDAYARALIARFENLHLAHSLRQIAMDGSQKLPYRLVAPLRARTKTGVAGEAIAAWMAFCAAEKGDVDDPRATDIQAALAGADPRAGLLQIIGASDLATLIPE